MTVHDEMAEIFAYRKPAPILARLVELESDRVIREYEIPEGMTGPEFEAWAHWLEVTAGPQYVVEIAGETRKSA